MSAEAPKAAVEDLIAKVVSGKALEAFDRYYADDVTMQENEQPPRVGKAKAAGDRYQQRAGLTVTLPPQSLQHLVARHHVAELLNHVFQRGAVFIIR